MQIKTNDVSFSISDNEFYKSHWDAYQKGNWEPELFLVMDKILTRSTTFFDIGAWVGPVTLNVAQKAKYVYAFEPDPVAFEQLSKNLSANPSIKNVEAINTCIAIKEETMKMGPRHDRGDSMSSILFAENSNGWDIKSIKLDEFIKSRGISGKMVFKIDIEGYEYTLIPTLINLFKNTDCVVYISTHPHLIVWYLKGQSLKDKISRRLRIMIANYKLVKSLSIFPYIYDSNLKCISVLPKIIKSFFTKYITDDANIIFSHKPLI